MTGINEMELEKYGTKKPKKNFKVHNDNDNGCYSDGSGFPKTWV